GRGCFLNRRCQSVVPHDRAAVLIGGARRSLTVEGGSGSKSLRIVRLRLGARNDREILARVAAAGSRALVAGPLVEERRRQFGIGRAGAARPHLRAVFVRNLVIVDFGLGAGAGCLASLLVVGEIERGGGEGDGEDITIDGPHAQRRTR